jgi:hypothetical protein
MKKVFVDNNMCDVLHQFIGLIHVRNAYDMIIVVGPLIPLDFFLGAHLYD